MAMAEAPISRPSLSRRLPAAGGNLGTRAGLMAGTFLLTYGLCLFMPALAKASETLLLTQLDHKIWSVRDGAPAPVFGLALDHDGTLWLAASSGLYQFDGLQFKEFQSQIGEPALPSGGYWAVTVATNGDVWVGSIVRGIARIRSGHVRLFNEHDGFPTFTVVQIREGPDGSIWAVVHGQLMAFDGSRWADAGVLRGLPDEGGVKSVFFDHEGTQWVCTARSVYYRRRDEQEFSQTGVSIGQNNDVINFAESKNGELWLGIQASGPASYDLLQLNVTGHRVSNPNVIHLPFIAEQMTFASDGSMWVAGSDLNRFEPVTIGPKQGPSRETFGTAQAFASENANAILEDQNGDIWLGTNSGVERFQRPVLVKYVGKQLNPSNLGLTRDAQGTIWIGVTRAPLLSVRGPQTTEHGPALSQAAILFADGHGAVWVRTVYEGLVREYRNRLEKVKLPNGVPDWAPRQFFEMSPGELDVYLSSFGVFRFDHGTWFKVDLPNQPRDEPVSFFVDKKGRTWIGYVDGKVGMVDGTSGHVFAVGKNADLSSVRTFLESSEGLLCGGLNGIAILRGDHFEVLPVAEPAALTGISGIVQTEKGDIWLNGIHGISRVAYSAMRAAISDGVPMPVQLFTQTEITGPSPNYGFPTAVADASGRLWFNTSGVIAYVDPEDIPHNTVPPTLVASAIEEDGQPVGQQKQVKAGTSTIRIPYFGANLFAPEKVRYMYWLHGVDKTWQDVGRRTEAVYTHLGPGKYRFEVKAVNGDGVWSAPVSLSFTVLPTFYQTLWFELLSVVACLMLLWLAFTLRVRYVAAGIRQRAEERANERVSIARELHDTLLQGVQGLLLSFHAAASKVPAEHESRKALERALASADRIILEGRDRVNRLRSEHLTNGELEPSIESVADDLTGLSKIDFALETTGTREALNPDAADEIFYIVREALTNSFRHSDASKIVVRIDYGEHQFNVSCRDDGRGFDMQELQRSEARGHWGLRGMAERAEKIGATFNYQSAPGKGAQIQLVLPASRAYVHKLGLKALFQRHNGRNGH